MSENLTAAGLTTSNLSFRSARTYGFDERSFDATYLNGRKTSGGSSDTYDLAGNVITSWISSSDRNEWQFDAAGRPARWEKFGPWGNHGKGAESSYDGDGRLVKRAELTKIYTISGGWGDWDAVNFYYIYSSVTGQKITDVTLDGSYGGTHVYMGSTLIAEQNDEDVDFKVTDPVTGSMWKTNGAGKIYNDIFEGARTEIAGMGTVVPTTTPDPFSSPRYDEGGDVGDPENGCEVDGTPMPCSGAARLANWIDYVDPPKVPYHKPTYYDQELPHIWDDFVGADNLSIKKSRKGLTKLEGADEGHLFARWMVDPMQTQGTLNNGSDCIQFARKVGQLAREYLDEHYPDQSEQVQKFMDELAKWGTELGSATAEAIGKKYATTSRNAYSGHDFSEGFREEFTDTYGPSSDQVRHAIGGLINGYVWGETSGQTAMTAMESDLWEKATPKSHAADLALNKLTVSKGSEIGGTNGLTAALGLSTWINVNLCEHLKAAEGRAK